ncbi:coiled-coil domain-containing protein 102A-like [Gossypium hirsutum]|uniref:Coiled-coil domain-containing protein 102A-like n=1 Tax=Gossypium hirsutum TaxID=3635 RepID=A0A1U8NPY3_GOSHI|nr:coiled-coil domain-containing protein 102A-like [Gossypium hirsutum]
MEEEKMNLRLDIDVQKLETEKLRKEKNKAEEELGSLKMDYKKLRLSMRTAGLRKTSEQWRAEIREEKEKADRWGHKFQEMQRRNEALEKKLKACLSKIEEMKKRIEELETALQNCEIRIKHLEVNENRNNEQLHYFQNQVRSRDHIMEEAVVQIREVADHVQTLAVHADMLSVEYELESDRGQELVVLLRKIRMLKNAIRSRKIDAGESSRRSASKKKENEVNNSSMDVVKLDDSPNTEDSLPNHNDNGVNMIGGSMGRKIKEDIAEVKIPLRWV